MKEATPEEVLAGNFDKVILAAGSRPLMPPIPGIGGKNVKTSTEALLGAPVGKNVVVIGGGLVGCETAADLKGKAETVTIIGDVE